MRVITDYIHVPTQGNNQMIDLTPSLHDLLLKNELSAGNATVFVSGSTAGITLVEYEPGLIKDIPLMLERIAPKNIRYHHDETWHDGNGHSHVRASIIGASMTIPFSSKKLLLGTWQQVVLIDFDNRPRKRDIVVQFIGE